jgi:hypothetical protein
MILRSGSAGRSILSCVYFCREVSGIGWNLQVESGRIVRTLIEQDGSEIAKAWHVAASADVLYMFL